MAIPISWLKHAPMECIVNAILTRYGLVEAFAHSAEFHLQLEQPQYMPLVIERQGNEVAVMHTFTQNGDLMSDPEITFSLPTWSPTSITQHPVGVYRRVYDMVNGRQTVNPRLLHELEAFARMWARNLWAQGFVDGDHMTATSLTHPELVPPQVTA